MYSFHHAEQTLRLQRRERPAPAIPTPHPPPVTGISLHSRHERKLVYCYTTSRT